MDKIKQFFMKAIRVLFIIIMGLILTDIFILCNVDYVYKRTFLAGNVILLLFMLLLMFVLFLFLYKAKIKEFSCEKLVITLVLFLFLIQVYICYNILFLSGWDSGQIVLSALFMVDGNMERIDFNYFSFYPNNILLVEIYFLFVKLNTLLQIFKGQHLLMSIVVINAFINSLSCYLVYQSVKNISRTKVAFAAFCISVLLFGFSPWTVICYSDSFALFFPVLVFYLYTKSMHTTKKRQVLYLVLAIAISLVGYEIKPQAAFVLIAIMLVEFVYNLKGKRMIYYFAAAAGIVLAGLGIQKGLDRIHRNIGFEINPEASVVIGHYFMMGLNKVNNGVYAEPDVIFSVSIPTLKERKKQTMAEAGKRLKEFGVGGYLNHLRKKMLVVYNDGTFAWGKEGSFYFLLYPEPNTIAAPFLRDVFYDNGELYPYFSTFLQGIWLLVLVLNVAAAVLCTKNSKGETVLYLTVLGITAFEILFEARARYLYIFAPIYCMIAALGAYRLYLKLTEIIRKRKEIRMG